MHSKSRYKAIVAPNASAMTLDGTQTYIVGDKEVVIIDPGPRSKQHLDAVADYIGSGVVVCVVLTHTHPDHAGGAEEMADAFAAPLRAIALGNLRDQQALRTDVGELVTLATPGHTADHASFFLASADAVFCGDLMMGGMDTALVALPEGNMRDYFSSLRKLAALRPKTICPAHGPEFSDPQTAIARYIEHREQRLAQVMSALRTGPAASEALLDRVYGASLDAKLRHYAETAIEAYLAYLEDEGTVSQAHGLWSLV